MNTISRMMLAGAALAVAGCTTNLPGGSLGGTFGAESYLGSTLEGTSFNDELARAYQKVASFNATSPVNWLDSTVYIERSKMAAAGSPAELYQPADFGVNGELEALRARTIAAVGMYAGERPTACAEAMAFYDHLVEATYQGDSAGQTIDNARAMYDAAITACEPPMVPEGIFFGFDSSAITAAADSIIRDLVAAIGGSGRPISVVGHTDTVGSVAYNQGLSERRATAVAQRMVQLGVPAGTITTAGRSENELAVPTGDGVREARNRRVEVVVSP
jgi:outer membrane protein OmpA-like peptidoglycan-associated protein